MKTQKFVALTSQRPLARETLADILRSGVEIIRLSKMTIIKNLLTIIISLTFGICGGQNLVPNGGFEQYTGCPSTLGQIYKANFWVAANGGSSDYFNQCGTLSANVPFSLLGFQQTQSGAGYSGIILHAIGVNYREYIEVPLSSPLIALTCYNF